MLGSLIMTARHTLLKYGGRLDAAKWFETTLGQCVIA